VAEFRQRVRDDGTRGVDLVGEIDLAVTSELLETVRECLAESDAVALDFDAVTFIDSSGLGALVLLRKEADKAHKKFFLANLSPAITRLLQVTGLEGTFDTLPEPGPQ
jgi:anti-anti-sigma factor